MLFRSANKHWVLRNRSLQDLATVSYGLATVICVVRSMKCISYVNLSKKRYCIRGTEDGYIDSVNENRIFKLV